MKDKANPELTMEDLELILVQEKNLEVTKIRFGNLLTIIIFSALAIIVTASTFSSWSEDKKNLKKIQLEKAKIAEENMKKRDPKYRGDISSSEDYSTVLDKSSPDTLIQKLINAFSI